MGYEDFEELFATHDDAEDIERPDLFLKRLMGVRGAQGDLPKVAETGSAPVQVPPGFRMGVWLDVGGRSLASHGATHASLLQELGFSDACIMINSSRSRRFGFGSVSEGTLRGFAPLLAGSGIRLTLTSWIRPSKRFIDDLVRRLPPLARDLGAHAIEFDAEGPWRGQRARGFSDHTEAAEYLYAALRPVAGGMEIAVTCEVDPMVHSRMRALLRGADLVVPQAYSAYRNDRRHRVGGAYGPRGLQNRALGKLDEAVAASGKSTIMGLAAWNRSRWPGHTADAIMRMELEHTLSLRGAANLLGARYWSWKHIVGLDARGGRPANRYAIEFLRRSVNTPGPAAAWSQTETRPLLPASVREASPGAADAAVEGGGGLSAVAGMLGRPQAARPAPRSRRAAVRRGPERSARAPIFRGDRVLHDVLNGRRHIRRGSRGTPVRKIQQALVELGHPLPRFGVDGIFGPETERAVRQFQTAQRIGVDGIVGPITMGRLDDAMAARQTPGGPPGPGPGREQLLHRTQVELPFTRQRLQAAKYYNTATGAVTLRATDRRGRAVNLDEKIGNERRAYLRRYRQIHPALMHEMQRRGPNDRMPIMIWVFHEHALPRKNEGDDGPVAVASGETVAPLPARPDHPTHTTYTETLRGSVRAALDRVRPRIQGTGAEVTGDLGTVPVLTGQATRDQIMQLSRLHDVTGLYLDDDEAGENELTNSIADARAATAHNAGFRGANIRVAVWELGFPHSVSDLQIEEQFDTTPTASESRNKHAQLVTAIIKNTQSSGSNGFAPDCKIFSANSYSRRALTWAIETKRCKVLNQSFSRPGTKTSDTMHADDLIKDYLILRPPFTTVVQAAGNKKEAAHRFVCHKGFNSMTVGNHVDGAGSMHTGPDLASLFENPASPRGDRELPDIAANGTRVSATGLTNFTGTSFAAPAVAGTAAVLQSVDVVLTAWPEGCRAILLASAGRNVSGGTWSQDATGSADGMDGSGALDTAEATRIARARVRRNSRPARRGWDVGTLNSSSFQSNGTSTFSYRVTIPSSGLRRLKAALAWNSKVTYEEDSSLTPPVRVTASDLTVDLDLYVLDGATLVAQSSTFDNSFEIVEFQGERGKTYEIKVKRFSGTDWTWFGIAWTLF